MKRQKKKIFLFDVNHTLINTATYHNLALAYVEKTLNEYVDKETAQYITNRFNEIFLLNVAGFLFRTKEEWRGIPGGKRSYVKQLDLISSYQKEVERQWGFIKKWSREVFLKIAADEIKCYLDKDAIVKVVTVYWDTITDLTEPFEEAKKLLQYIYTKGYLAYILTSSDGRLQINSGFFVYDPEISGNYKKNRMETLRKKGLQFREIIVGDPEDKPSPGFFNRAIKTIEKDLGESVDPKDLIMIGNSFEDDLETPINVLGFGTGVLFDKGAATKRGQNGIHKVGDLFDVIEVLNL